LFIHRVPSIKLLHITRSIIWKRRLSHPPKCRACSHTSLQVLFRSTELETRWWQDFSYVSSELSDRLVKRVQIGRSGPTPFVRTINRRRSRPPVCFSLHHQHSSEMLRHSSQRPLSVSFRTFRPLITKIKSLSYGLLISVQKELFYCSQVLVQL